jgi:hypothetical protein
MLRLYARSLVTNDQQGLTDLSAQVQDLYLNRSRSEREVIPHSFGNSLALTRLEFYTVLEGLLNKKDMPLSIWQVLGFSIGLPLIVTRLDAGSPMQPRAIFDFMLSVYPWKNFLSRTLRDVGFPPGHEYLATTITGGFLQVLSIEISHGQPLKLVPVVFKTAVLAGLLHVSAQFIRRCISPIFPYIPDDVWGGLLAQVFAPFIQRFVRFGGVSTLTWITEKTVQTVMNFCTPALDDLPPTTAIPSSLECPICHDLLKNPVVVLGHFFCASCLERWLKSSSTHPYTGETISEEMVEQSILMSRVVYKWHSLAWQNIHVEENGQ